MEKLEQLLEEYTNIKNQIDLLNNKKNELSEEIKDILDSMGGKYSNNGYKAAIVEKVTFTYDDKTAIINYIIKKGLKDIYLTTEISSTKLNTELKKGGTLYERLKKYMTKNITESLTVTVKKED